MCKTCRCTNTKNWQANQRKNDLDFYLSRRKSNTYKAKYGLSLLEVQSMVDKQENSCLICKKELTSFAVDHDHTTGKVRGILCFHCNVGLGYFMDNTKNLSNAIEYLNDAKNT